MEDDDVEDDDIEKEEDDDVEDDEKDDNVAEDGVEDDDDVAEDGVEEDDVEVDDIEKEGGEMMRVMMWRRRTDPKTATHSLREPAQSTCTWTARKSHSTREFTGKMPRPGS